MPKLFCEKCNTVETYTAGEVERIVYALGAFYHDEVHSNDQLTEAEKDAYDVQCLGVILSSSYDCEGYLEHVNSLVDGRKWSKGRK